MPSTFIINNEILNKFIFALENQKVFYKMNLFNFTIKEALLCKDSKDYISLPKWSNLEAMQLRKEYIETLKNWSSQKILLQNLNSGQGAFQNFKKSLAMQGLTRDWLFFKKEYFKGLLIEWLEPLTLLGEEWDDCIDLFLLDLNFSFKKDNSMQILEITGFEKEVIARVFYEESPNFIIIHSIKKEQDFKDLEIQEYILFILQDEGKSLLFLDSFKKL